jgi:hypothetical protein
VIDDRIRPSSEIDAYCTKCRLVTNHRVVAMVDNVVKRVICLTCNGQHNFRPPPGQKNPKRTGARRVTKDKKRDRTVASKPFEHWQELKAALDPENPPAPYNMKDTYTQGQAIEHAKFGLGFVIKVPALKKIEVMFETEIKTLAMNMG